MQMHAILFFSFARSVVFHLFTARLDSKKSNRFPQTLSLTSRVPPMSMSTKDTDMLFYQKGMCFSWSPSMLGLLSKP